MIKTVKFLPLLEASLFVPSPGDAMVSIMGFGGAPASLSTMWPEARLLRQFYDDTMLEQYGCFTVDQARELVRWLDGINDIADRLIVHCIAGVSRSAAVAKFVCECYGIPFDDSYRQHNLLVYDRLKEAAEGMRS